MRRTHLALCLALAAAQPALAGGPAAVGQTGKLRVEIDVTGTDNGRTIHRTQTFVLRIQAEEPSFHNGLAAKADEDSPAASNARQQRDARMEQRMAKARASQQALDMDAIARACNRDQDSAACKAGQRAFAASMAQVDQAMQETYADNMGGVDMRSRRFQRWHALQTPGGGCGTVEAKVRDPGKPQQVARLPASAASAQIDTCFSSLVVDSGTGEVFLHLTPVEVLRPGGQRGDFVIEGADFGEDGDFDTLHSALTIRAVQPSGSASYPSYRGVAKVRWSFQPG